MASKFDPAAFESTVIDQSNETKMTPLPEGDYLCTIHGVKVNSWKDKEGTERPVLDVTWEVLDQDPKFEDVRKELHRDTLRVNQRVFLDTTEDGKSLAFGANQNVQLGRLREAVNMNKPGKPFTFKALEGAGPAMVSVQVKENPNTGDPFNQIGRVSKPE